MKRLWNAQVNSVNSPAVALERKVGQWAGPRVSGREKRGGGGVDEQPIHRSNLTDHLLRGLCSAVLLTGLGFLDHPNSLWGAYFRLVAGRQPQPTVVDLVLATVAFGGLSLLFGAAIETALITVGLRLSSRATDEDGNYDDRQR